MKKILYLMVLISLPTILWGEDDCKLDYICEQIFTNDGSVYEGYILKQELGNEITFYSMISTNTDTTYTGESLKPTFIPKEKLDERWLWLINQGRISLCLNNGQLGLMLHSFETKGHTASNVLVLAKNGNSIRYIEASNKEQIVKLLDIKHIEYTFNPNETSQLIDVITFNDNRVALRGLIAKQIIGKSLYIREIATNVIVEVSLKDVKNITKEANNNSLRLDEQSKWIETITLKNGTSIKGVVTSKDYGSNNSDAYMLVNTSECSTQIVRMEDVQFIEKRFNDGYISIPAYNLGDSDASLFNGVPVDIKSLETSNTSRKKGDVVICGADTLFTEIKVKTDSLNVANIIVQSKNGADSSFSIIAYKVILTHDNKLVLYYKEMLNHSICPSTEVIGNVVVNRFNLSLGKYVFYIRETGKAYFVNIT